MFCIAVGKADTSLLAQQQSAADITVDKVSAQPTQLAASYNIGMIASRLPVQVMVHSLLGFRCETFTENLVTADDCLTTAAAAAALIIVTPHHCRCSCNWSSDWSIGLSSCSANLARFLVGGLLASNFTKLLATVCSGQLSLLFSVRCGMSSSLWATW